jgi:hypothetical protein
MHAGHVCMYISPYVWELHVISMSVCVRVYVFNVKKEKQTSL